ncbi:phosphoglucosamine mutase [Lysobacter soyae]|uniref:Phosphoglucosamine mutase n=1 Tax=Lysobacter soyae TaxID=2764185 RepID=A0ABX8WMM7_9GAMM|nr:phosphoglucosamine mutase [Lysobacter sp. CJ11]QYR52068.1 phosphoglucosamine mutase [Lysobacter sp. CJ11]
MSGRKWFGTDGIRGRVGSHPISADFVLQLGNAYGRVLSHAHQARGNWRKPVVVIGKDTRISNYMFEAALEAGLVSAGVDVQLMGPMPTPAVSHLTRSLRADGGIVISASHNPHHDNGIKFFNADGEKIDDETERAIEAAIDAPFETVASEKLGKAVRTRDAVGRYVEACKNSIAKGVDLSGMHLVIDCANGANYQIGPMVFREMGAKVDVLGVDPDGTNINDGVGSTHPAALAEKVVALGAELGIAFDGDGDRVVLVDGAGNVRDGDDILFVLAKHWKAQGRLKGPVVGTLMTNFGFEKSLADLGIPFMRSNVGDRYVLRMLLDNAGILGGEASGHVLCLDRSATGDGIIAALQVLEALRESGESLDEALRGLKKVPQKTRNVKIANAKQVVERDDVKAALDAAKRLVEGRGRAFLRPSGTEPVVRVTVEADDMILVDQALDALAAVVEQAH